MGRIFVNRTLNMKRITHLGLDMDHTLIRYKSENFEALAHKIMRDKLVNQLDYPSSILKLEFDFNRCIRGLVIDKAKGNVLKLSRFGAIRRSYHGLSAIDYKTQNKLYRSTYVDLSDDEFDTVDTSFSISFAHLFSQLVDLKDNSEPELPDYTTMASDLNRVLDQAHRDGSLKNVVMANLDDFVIKDPDIVEGLERFIKHDKKVFIVTNSEFEYSKVLLDYAINPFLKEHKSWQDLFQFVITSAQKPRFFYDKLRYLKVDPDTGTMTNVDSKITPGVYQGGCAQQLTDDLGIEAGQILYVGDHIYGDVLRLKKDCSWRTALVVEELEDEVEKLHQTEPITQLINDLMAKKIPLEIKIDKLISENIESDSGKNQKLVQELLDEISGIDKELSPLIKKQQAVYNPYWGEVMRIGIEESYFAHQVERFACIYMAKLTDLLRTSPRTYFRAAKRQQAHEH